MGLRCLLASLAALFMASQAAARSPAGELDVTFGVAGRIEDIDCLGAALAVQTDGKIITGGSSHGGIGSQCVARYLPDGSPDAAFGTAGKVTLPGAPSVFDFRVDSTG